MFLTLGTEGTAEHAETWQSEDTENTAGGVIYKTTTATDTR